MHRLPRTAAIAAALSPSVLAQTEVVSPAALTNAYGGINNSIPFGGYQSAEQFTQQIHDDLAGKLLIMKGMGFRPRYTVAQAARTYAMRMTVGEAAHGSASMSTTFASNWKTGGSMTVALNGNVNYPGSSVVAAPPADFLLRIPFSNSVIYTGSGPLMWEVYISKVSATSPTYFFERGPGSRHVSGAIGTGCTVTGQSAPLTSSGNVTRTALTESLANAPASGIRFVAVGTTADSWSGLPLPVDLSLIGSPGCQLHIDLVGLLAPTSATSLSSNFTWSAALAGERIRTQWVVDDGGRVRTSNGLDHSIPHDATTWPLRRCWATGFGANLPSTGSIQRNGLVTLFY